MRLHTPSFWFDTKTPAARARAMALSSFSALYAIGHIVHQHSKKPRSAGVKVICIGNLVAGGSGKTPAALAVMELVRERKLAAKPCFLSRGYGGSLSGPLLVDPKIHDASMVGDEPCLLADAAPTIISASRLAGAKFAKAQGYDLVVMDDGLQNPALKKDIAIIVIDGATGFGNGLLLPAGPLRTPLHTGFAGADAVLLIGDDATGALSKVPDGKPVLRGTISALPPLSAVAAPLYFAFCGIAHPEKFWDTLEKAGIKIAGLSSFPDHHVYTPADIAELQRQAAELGARLITTTKDSARLRDSLVSPDTFDTLEITLDLSSDSADILGKMISHEK
ncbi:MAG: Tetraacyldisaccharide 4-kinase [Micavibrio sp.]|nr:Tetraacyldisaccharide 4-kinase [Micavibrio sp.]